MISDKNVVNDLTSLLHSYGVKHVVISPGSRNAPFIISFTNQEVFTCYSIVDERSAGYFALGISQQTQSPVALVCTSGTASLNYFSAIAEAYFQKLPLVVITADRPVERIGQGEGQSIFQKNVYGRHVKASVELIEDYQIEGTSSFNHRTINETMAHCLSPNRGPVHFNVPLSENLYGTIKFPKSFPQKIKLLENDTHLTTNQLNEVENVLQSSKKILILVGSLNPTPGLTEQLVAWSKRYGAFVLTENTSNIVDASFVNCVDRLIMSLDEDESLDFHPELLITLGNNLISKKIKFLLRSKKIVEHWHISKSGEMMDTFQSLSRVFAITPSDFFEQTNQLSPSASNYPSRWKQKDLENQKKQKTFSPPFSDYQIVEKLLTSISKDSVLQMGNSSLVRYAQLFDPRKDVQYYANRGTSGIDGCVSTAVGFSVNAPNDVYLMVGDISFLYDSNAFWNQHLTNKLKIILINNGGGGIFDIIEGPSTTNSLDFFTTRHRLNASHLCAMHQVDYHLATTIEEFDQKFGTLKTANNCALLEVTTQGIPNDKILKDFFAYLATK